MSYKKESAYGTQVLEADIDVMFEPLEPILIEPTIETYDDAPLIKGHEFPDDTTKDIVVATDLSIPFRFPSSLPLIGLLFAFGMGASQAGGDPSDYTHIQKIKDLCTTAGAQLPSTSWVVGLVGDTASYFTVKGLCINEVSIGLDAVGWLPVTGTAIGDGSMTAASAFTWPTTYTSADFVTNVHCDFKVATTSKKALLRGFSFSVNNNLDLADARSQIAAAGTLLGELNVGTREVSLTVTVAGHQGDEFWTAFTARTVQRIDIEVTVSSVRKLTIVLAECRISDIRPGFDGLRDTLEITYKPYYQTTDSSPVVFTVYNGVAEYLVAST
jgi:hypothetical protein